MNKGKKGATETGDGRKREGKKGDRMKEKAMKEWKTARKVGENA